MLEMGVFFAQTSWLSSLPTVGSPDAREMYTVENDTLSPKGGTVLLQEVYAHNTFVLGLNVDSY